MFIHTFHHPHRKYVACPSTDFLEKLIALMTLINYNKRLVTEFIFHSFESSLTFLGIVICVYVEIDPSSSLYSMRYCNHYYHIRTYKQHQHRGKRERKKSWQSSFSTFTQCLNMHNEVNALWINSFLLFVSSLFSFIHFWRITKRKSAHNKKRTHFMIN